MSVRGRLKLGIDALRDFCKGGKNEGQTTLSGHLSPLLRVGGFSSMLQN